MNYIVGVVWLIIFFFISSFSNLDVKYYDLQSKFYTNLKIFDFDKINTLTNYSTCIRETIEWTNRLWYCLFPNQKRELYIPNYDSRATSYHIIRQCWLTSEWCKNEISDNGMLYYQDWTILGCQYGVEWLISPNVTGLSNWDVYTLQFKSLKDKLITWNTKTVSVIAWDWPYTALTEEALLRNILEKICVWGGAAGKCISPDINISTTGRPCDGVWPNITWQSCYEDFNNFSFYLWDDNKSLIINLKDPRYELSDISATITDGNPLQDITTYKRKQILNKCEN